MRLRHRLRRRFQTFLIFLAVLGPGMITSNVDNDAGGITTYSLAGAQFGYNLLWVMIPVVVALIVIQEMVARMGVVTGKGLADLIRERFGVRTTVYLLLAIVITNYANTVSEFAGIAASLEIFNISRHLSVPVGAILVWLLVVKGNYKTVEKVFLVACLVYFTYIVSALMARPDWSEVLRAVKATDISFDSKSLAMVIGLVGTTIAPWMQFYLQSAIVEKKIHVNHLKHSRWDVISGSVIVNVVAFFIIVACGATLFVKGVQIETAKEAALALAPLAGKYASYLFAFGLLNASLFSASILPLSTAYMVCEGMGWQDGVDKKFSEAPLFYLLYTLLILGGAVTVLLPGIPLIKIMYFSQVLNGIVLPLILVFMLLLVNDRRLMGKYVNGPVFNAIAIVTAGTLIVLSILLVSFVR